MENLYLTAMLILSAMLLFFLLIRTSKTYYWINSNLKRNWKNLQKVMKYLKKNLILGGS
jgi:hypothetical protein